MLRRRFLGGAALLGTSGIVGCTELRVTQGRPSTGETPETVRPTDAGASDGKTSREQATEEPRTDRSGTVGRLEHSWRTYAHDARNSGHTSALGPTAPVGEAWSVGGSKAVFTTPAVADGRVVFGAANGRVYGVDAVAGTTEWTYETGDYVSSSPAVVDGTVYVGSGDLNVYAVDATSGAERWRAETRAQIDGAVAVADGIVVAAGRSVDRSGWVYGLDADDGSVTWKREVDDWVTNAPAIADGTAFAATHRGTVYAFDLATGTEHWAMTGPSSEANHVTAPAIADGSVFVLMRDFEGETTSRLYALEADSGEEEWSVRIAGPNLPDNVAVDDGSVVTVSEFTRQCEEDSGMPCVVPVAVVTAVDAASGDRHWQRRWEASPDAGPTLDDERLYLVADGEVLALDRSDGAERWRYDLEGFGRQPPSVSDGVLFVGGADGTVRAIVEL